MSDPARATPSIPSAPDSTSGDPVPRRSPLATVVAIAVALTGAVWLLQGLGILAVGNSFMTGDPLWAVIGAAFVATGAGLALRARRAA